MTKSELLAALFEVPDDAEVYLEQPPGILRSLIDSDVLKEAYGTVIILTFNEPDEDDEPEDEP